MKVLSLAGASLGVVFLPAQAFAATHVSVGVQSSNIDGYTGYQDDADPSYYGQVDYKNENGFYAGVWLATDNDGVADYGNERDYWVGYATDVAAYNISLEAVYYDIYGVDGLAFSAIVSRDYDWGSPYVDISTYMPTEADGWPSGQIYRAGVENSFEFSDRWSADTDAAVFYDTGTYGGFEATTASLTVDFKYKVNDSLTASVRAAGFETFSEVYGDGGYNNSYIGVTLSASL